MLSESWSLLNIFRLEAIGIPAISNSSSVPPDATPSNSFFLGLFLLIVSTYTLTINNNRLLWAIFRVALTPFAIYFFWDFGYGPHVILTNQIGAGLAGLGSYGIMRVLETSIVGFFDDRPPYWIINEDDAPLPGTLRGRLFYSIDLVTSARGNSWFSDRHWNWAPKSLVDFPNKNISRKAFLRGSAITFIQQYLLYDVLDTLNKSRKWDTEILDPITRLPLHEQLIFSFSVCATNALSIDMIYLFCSTTFVLLGSSPSNWPPMFNKPFSATSLADFWANRWHAYFRRVFDRLSQGILYIMPIPKSPSYIYKHARAIIIFALSASMHIMVMYRLDRLGSRPKPLLDPSILKFFLLQPLGLAIEASILIPALRIFVPKEWHLVITRVWTWCFMLWVGRFWSDVWVHRGLWLPINKFVDYSVARGIIWGKWVV